MGQYINPGNENFKTVVKDLYVDKTLLLEIINGRLGGRNIFFCNSRPRRFGKSITTDMLAAYYDRSCDSSAVFAPFKIAGSTSFKQHMNKYDVLYLDVQDLKWEAGGAGNLVNYMQRVLIQELQEAYPEVCLEQVNTLSQALTKVHAFTGVKFAIILDEWDCIIRDDGHLPQVQEEYIEFLRSLFKGPRQLRYLAFAYLTGIFPIKKYNTQSALNLFEEYTILEPSVFASYMGFTENEVLELCQDYGRDFALVKRWYDGYLLQGQHVYNPRAVAGVMTTGEYRSYWSKTGTFKTIQRLINHNFTGLKDIVVKMLAGEAVPVRVGSFDNDVNAVKSLNDVLTALIHLGYLAYDKDARTAFIPNEEIRSEFLYAVEDDEHWQELNKFIAESEALLQYTWQGDASAVAQAVNRLHQDYASIIQYNDENSLSSVLGIGYLATMNYYYKPVREMPAGKGFADLLLYPKVSNVPALIIELKWNKDAATALEQIKERNYTAALSDYKGKLLLVGISYDKSSKKHSCVIEEMEVP